MEVITISTDAFKAIMDKMDRIERKLKGQVPQSPLKDTWLDIQEVCDILKISKRTLQKYRNDGTLPFSKVEGKVYFKASDVQKHLEKHYKKLRR